MAQYLIGQGTLTIECLFPKGVDGLVNTRVLVGTWRNNLSPVVAALNLGQSGRTITTLVLIGYLA
jgi:hypothetical protein